MGDRRGSNPNSIKNLEKGRTIGAKNERNCNWKGNKASYSAFHHWLDYNYGKANKCENPNCVYPRKIRRRGTIKKILITEPKMFNWALIKGKRHEQKRENYFQLCVSCHALYDKNKIVVDVGVIYGK